MTIGLRQRKADAPQEAAEDLLPENQVDQENRDQPPEIILPVDAFEETFAPAPAAARPARPRPPSAAKGRAGRRGVLSYVLYALLFVVVASLSAAVVLLI